MFQDIKMTFLPILSLNLFKTQINIKFKVEKTKTKKNGMWKKKEK